MPLVVMKMKEAFRVVSRFHQIFVDLEKQARLEVAQWLVLDLVILPEG